MDKTLKDLLKNLSLSEREALVYLASLRLGEANVTEIAHVVQLTRTTTASILGRLVNEGFISVNRSKGKQMYWIEDPHLLVDKQRARLEVAEHLSAQLHAEYHAADKKPTVEIFETTESISHLMAKVVQELSKGDTIDAFEVPAAGHYQAILSDELFHAMSRQKVAKGIKTRALIPAGQQSEIRAESLKHNVEVRTLPSELRFEISMWSFKDSFVLFSGTHTFAVRINNRHIHESISSLFNYLWHVSAPVTK